MSSNKFYFIFSLTLALITEILPVQWNRRYVVREENCIEEKLSMANVHSNIEEINEIHFVSIAINDTLPFWVFLFETSNDFLYLPNITLVAWNQFCFFIDFLLLSFFFCNMKILHFHVLKFFFLLLEKRKFRSFCSRNSFLSDHLKLD